MYSELYAPIPDAKAYLARLGMEAEEPGLDYLDRLISAHLKRIPFENLDVWDKGICPSLGVGDIFEKIVLRRRGGYCFELNGLFTALLRGLGFEVYSVGARIMVGRNYLPPVSHQAQVCVIDGKKYFCDVGFGTVAIKTAVPMDGSTTPDGFQACCWDGSCAICQYVCGERSELMIFEDKPCDPVDFIIPNFYNSQKSDMPFRASLSVSIMTDSGRKQLVNFGLKEYRDGQIVSLVTAKTRGELSRLLDKHFGIEYPMSD